MRTTVSLDDNLLAAARRRAGERGQTLGKVLEDALRHELSRPAETSRPVEVPVFHGGDGPLPGIDLRSNRGLRTRLDDGIELNGLR